MNEESAPKGAPRAGHHTKAPRESTPPVRRACVRGCALACNLTSWGWVLDADHVADPATRLFWALHGLPSPVPAAQHVDLYRAFADRFGVGVLVAGLRLAASTPAPHGADVDPGRFASLARRLTVAS